MASKIYTGKGDSGKTILPDNTTVTKYDDRVEALGTLEELNSYLGVLHDLTSWPNITEKLTIVQHKIINCKYLLTNTSVNKYRISQDDISLLEKEIDKIEAVVGVPDQTILPGGHPLVAYCHVAYSICRRAERQASLVCDKFNADPIVIAYLNRLSDYLFMLSRFFVKALQIKPTIWNPNI